MGTTGLIFGALAAAWLAYLVPWFVSQRHQATPVTDDATLAFTQDAKLLQSGEVELGPDPDLEVSTELTRRAAKREIAVSAVVAAARRRRVLLVLLVVVTVLGITTALGRTPWWAVAGAGALLVAWLAVARVSVARMHRRLDRQVALLDLGDDEATVVIRVSEGPELPAAEGHEHSVEISGPILAMDLREPIPVAPTTYVSRPLAQRTVRTIDLSAPAAPPRAVPVTADDGLLEETEQRKAVGE